MEQVTEADLARSRADPLFRQALLTQSLERLLATLYRHQRDPASLDAAGMLALREGAMMAARLADMIRALDEKLTAA
jgi:hypothetical protein